jgi:hypothetical protein
LTYASSVPRARGRSSSLGLTGFFGENFGWEVRRIAGGGTFLVLGLGSELAALIILLAFFKLRGWF